MEHTTTDIARKREDEYFRNQEQERLEEIRRAAAREAETLRLMQAFGIRDREVVRELADAGFDRETFRLLYLVPLIEVAWSDGQVSDRESEQVLKIATLHGIRTGTVAHARLKGWLTERPPDQFFQACVRGIRAMLRYRSAADAGASRRDLVWYCTRIASASGGFFGWGSRISPEEEQLLKKLAEELDARHHDAVNDVVEDLGEGHVYERT